LALRSPTRTNPITINCIPYYRTRVSANKAEANRPIAGATGAIHVLYSRDRQRHLFHRDVLFSERLNKDGSNASRKIRNPDLPNSILQKNFIRLALRANVSGTEIAPDHFNTLNIVTSS
jgi:hypothetical protein